MKEKRIYIFLVFFENVLNIHIRKSILISKRMNERRELNEEYLWNSLGNKYVVNTTHYNILFFFCFFYSILR